MTAKTREWLYGETIAPGVDCGYNPSTYEKLAMTLATLALFADQPTHIAGIGSWRVKETERLVAVRDQLRKAGATVEQGPDWIRVTPPEQIRSATIETYDDHLMAMAFSLVAAATETVILDPDCTSKTFPGYFEALQRLSGTP